MIQGRNEPKNIPSLRGERKQILIVDPCLIQPEVDAYNLLNRMVFDLSRSEKSSLSALQFCLPNLGKHRICDVADKMDVAGIIALGSYANVADSHSWIKEMRSDLAPFLFEKKTPFLGICFSHQLLADMFGNDVSFLRNRAFVPEGKYTGFRNSKIVHPKIATLFAKMSDADFWSDNEVDREFAFAAKAMSQWDLQDWRQLEKNDVGQRYARFLKKYTPSEFVAEVRHEQEVLLLKNPDLLLGATSEECVVDALVHRSLPIFSVQAHPESVHESFDGWRFLKNFIYFCSLVN